MTWNAQAQPVPGDDRLDPGTLGVGDRVNVPPPVPAACHVEPGQGRRILRLRILRCQEPSDPTDRDIREVDQQFGLGAPLSFRGLFMSLMRE